MKRKYNGSLTLLAQLKEVKYQPIKKNPKTKTRSNSRTIEFDDRWELLWDPKKKILYGVKKKNFNLLKGVDLSGIINHPSYKMVKIFKDQDVKSAFELEVDKRKFQKLGKGVHVVYKSDKWNPKKYYEYIHEFGEDGYVVYKNHNVNIYYDPINQIYKMCGGKLDVDERGIIF